MRGVWFHVAATIPQTTEPIPAQMEQIFGTPGPGYSGCHPVAEICDCLPDPLIEFHRGFPPKDLFRPRNVRLPHLRVVYRQWLVVDRRLGPSDPNDLVGELFDGHLPRVANV